MKSGFVIVLLAVFASVFVGCGKFTAEIKADNTAGAAPLNVVFTNDGSDAESQEWNFGDGSEPQQTGATATATHNFTKAGTFTVTLNTTKGDKTATSSMTVTVSPGPMTQINFDGWQTDVEVGNSALVQAVAVDDFGNPVEGASLSYAAPADAGTVDANGMFQASTTSGEFPDGLAVTAVQGGNTINATASVNVVPAALDHVEIEPSELSLTPTESVEIIVHALDKYGNEITDAGVQVVPATGVGTVSDDTFTAARTVTQSDEGITITVDDGGQSQEVKLSVEIVPGPLDSVKITPASYEAEVASTEAFTAVGLDAYGNEIADLDIAWSADEDAGQISSSGSFSAGTVAGSYESSITASATQDGESVDGSIDVTLLPGDFSEVVVTSGEIVAGEETQLDAAAADEYGNPIEGATVAWELLDDSAGGLSDSGMLAPTTHAGVYADALKVEATKDGQTESGTFDVTIVAGSLSQVAMLPGDLTLGIGMSQQYVAVAGDRYGNRIPEATLTWSASGSAGTIGTDGAFVAGNTPGKYSSAVTVTASFGGKQATKSATVQIETDKIMFLSDRDSALGQFFLMDIDGSNQTGLNFGQLAYSAASWSPDGRRVVYDSLFDGVLVTDDSGLYIWLVAENTGDASYTSPVWSPDGSKFVMVSWDANGSHLVLADIDGGNITDLTQPSANYELYPSWSPDGKFVVYDVSNEDGVGDIYRINVQTKQKQRLTTNPADDSDPAYSPDGTKILFATARDGNYEVYVMDANGANTINLTKSSQNDANARWSSDGSLIVFASNRDGDAEVYLMHADGSSVTKLTNNSDDDYAASWAPRKAGITVDADAIILPSEEPGAEQTTQSLTASLRASVVRIVTDLGSGSGFVVHEDGLILTNDHVVKDASEITVTLDDGTEYTGTVVARDLTHDLAVVRIDATGLQAVEFGSMTQDDLGSDVIVLGYPLGSSDLNVTTGVVSAVKVDEGRGSGWVQTDAAVNPGNSGGPMVNLQGQVVGIVSAGLFGTQVENVGLAVDSTTILTYLDRLLAGETIIIN